MSNHFAEQKQLRSPLSFTQQRIWFLEQLNPGKSHYNDYVAFRLKGMLNIDALERSFSEIVRRHEILRTTFSSIGDESYQQVAPWQPQKLRLIDLQDVPAEEREARARHMAEVEVEQSFDFTNGPLLKIQLYQLAEDDYVLVTMYHHTIGDAWSVGVLFHECSLLYDAYCVGETPSLPELPMQYADYTLWQREWLQGEALQKQLDYWREQLKNAPTQLNLPTDRPRPAVQTYAGSQQSLLIPGDLYQQLKALSQREGVTLYMTLLAAFQVLLMRYSGQDDFLIGTSIANRTRRELEGLIGFFANTLVLRGDLSGNPSFQQLLRRVQEMMLQAYANQDVPFEKLVAELEPERDLSRQPLYQVQLVFQQFVFPAFELPGVVWSPFQLTKTASKFDLLMALREEEGGLLTTIEYSTDIFEATTIEQLLTHWLVLLQAIVRDSTQPVEQLPLLTEDEQERLLQEWNAVEQSQGLGSELPLHQIIEVQVEAMPDRVAVVFEGEHLTYEGLNIRANRLAHTLRREGVGTDVLVGICLERSLEMVVSLLGILKAGGAYVPFDPSTPPKRLAAMLTEAQVSLVITQAHLRPRLSLDDIQTICLDNKEFWSHREQEDDQNLLLPVCWDQLAYLIYTSGSTGKPKGVMVSYSGLRPYMRWSIQYCDLTLDSSSIVHTSLAFDLTISSLFPPLLVGATVLLAREEPGIEGLLDALDYAPGRTLLKFTPSHLYLLDNALVGSERSWMIQTMIIGGEILRAERLTGWRERPESRLINEYGPTETVVACSVYDVNTDEALSGSVPIGRPIADCQIYLLDRAGRPVPRGVPGEIYIGGTSLARGYVRQPEQTAERFVPNPFSKESGARLYRTGDLGRYGHDGQFRFVGRRDEQVKLRGYRIELGEIEMVLREHPQVAEAVVRVWQGEREEQSTSQQVREYLRDRLPEYMVPAQVQWLEAVPLTKHGKVDWRALPKPELMAEETEEVLVEPRNPLEEQLSVIWDQVMGHPSRGVYENFFEAGGHSLLGMLMMARVRKQLGVDVPLRSLFESPTIAGLATVIEQKQATIVEQAQSKELERLLREVEELSEEEARALSDSEL